jgi:hypothetical protein
MQTTIVKVQLPLDSDERTPQALVYDEGHAIVRTVPITASLRKKMAGAMKKFFYATIEGDAVRIGAAAAWQNW